jgi:hypothetical protein
VTGAALIALERARQIHDEGYTAEHDHGHAADLVAAAAGYVLFQQVTVRRGFSPEEAIYRGGNVVPPEWPAGWPWKPTGEPVRDLTKAGALVAAAIDALLPENDQPPRVGAVLTPKQVDLVDKLIRTGLKTWGRLEDVDELRTLAAFLGLTEHTNEDE